MKLFALALCLALPAQDELESLLLRLSDDSPSVRSEATHRILRGYEAWRLRLERALAAATDADLQGRLRDILAEGAWNAQRTRFETALPDRVRRQYPGFANAVFSKNPQTRREAVLALSQVHDPGDARAPFRMLYLSPAEARRAIPEMVAVIDPAPEFEQVRFEWMRVLFARPEFLADPEWAKRAGALYRDPSPRVREFALCNLPKHVFGPEDLAQLLARWDDAPRNERWYALHQIARRNMADGFPKLVAALEDPDTVSHAVGLVFQFRRHTLYPRALQAIEKHGNAISTFTLEHLPPEHLTPVLLKLLSASTNNLIDLLRLLQARGTREAAEPVLAYLSHRDPRVRDAALDVLVKVGEPRHAPQVAGLLRAHLEAKDPPYFNIMPGLHLLAKWEAGDEIVLLLEHLPRLQTQDFNCELRGIFEKLRPAGVGKKLAPYLASDNRPLAIYALDLMGCAGAKEEARANLERIRSLLSHSQPLDFQLRQAALGAARLGLKECHPLILSRLDDPQLGPIGPLLAEMWPPEERRAALRSTDARTRRAGALAFRYEDWADSGHDLEALAVDPEPEVRKGVALALEMDFSERGARLLLKLAGDPDPSVASKAAECFYRYGRPQTRPHRLAGLLRHPAGTVRANAIRYFSEPDLRRDPGLLETLLKDPDPGVQRELRERRWVPNPDDGRRLEETLLKEKDALKLVSALYELETHPGAVALLGRFLERMIAEVPPTVEPRLSTILHSDMETNLSSVMTRAGEAAHRIKSAALEPILLKMLAGDRTELQLGAANALGGLGSKAAAPRLLELVLGPAGDAAAEALGRLGVVPRMLFRHPDAVVRKRAFRAAELARDRGSFDALLEAARDLSGDEFKAALSAIATTLRAEDVRKLFGLMATPDDDSRGAVLELLCRYADPALADEVAEYLDDPYTASFRAARFLMDADAVKYAPRMARQMEGQYTEFYARIVGRFGLREEAPRLLEVLNVDGSEKQEAPAAAAEALADLGLKEHLAAVVAKTRSTHDEMRLRMIPSLARLGGREAAPALREFLRSPTPAVRLAAALGLVEVGEPEPIEGIKAAVRDEINMPAARQIILTLRLSDLAREAILKAERRQHPQYSALALAARLGIPGARDRVLELLKLDPEEMVGALQEVWRPSGAGTALDSLDWTSYARARTLLGRVEKRAGRQIVLACPVPEGFLDTIIQGDRIDRLIASLPEKSSYFIDDERIVIDRLDRVVTTWKGFVEGLPGP